MKCRVFSGLRTPPLRREYPDEWVLPPRYSCRAPGLYKRDIQCIYIYIYDVPLHIIYIYVLHICVFDVALISVLSAYYPHQQIHNIYILTAFPMSCILVLPLCYSYKTHYGYKLNTISTLKCLHI